MNHILKTARRRSQNMMIRDHWCLEYIAFLIEKEFQKTLLVMVVDMFSTVEVHIIRGDTSLIRS